MILLETSARMWDSTGSTSADRIRMDQHTGDFTAEEREFQPAARPGPKEEFPDALGRRAAAGARAQMASTNHNRSIHYEGNAQMWQGANRILADAIDLDRRSERWWPTAT